MNRRTYIKSVASTTAAASLVSVASAEQEEAQSEEDWNLRGTWRRRTETGVLEVNGGVEQEFESYQQWGSAMMDAVSETDTSHIVNLFDFRLISIYDGEYYRSHFGHDNGLEVTIKQDPEDDVRFRAFVRHVSETWDEARIYASDAQVALASKIADERDEYL